MAVTPTGTPVTGNSGGVAASSKTISVTVGALVNGALAVTISQYSSADSTPSVTWNGSGTGVAQISTDFQPCFGDGRRLTVIRVLSPGNITANLVVTWSTSIDEFAVIIDRLENVNQTTPTGTPVTGHGQANNTTTTLNITSAVGGIVYDCLSVDAAGVGATSVAGLTVRSRLVSAANETEGDAQYANGTGGLVAATWTTGNSGQGNFVHIGFPINEATGGGTVASGNGASRSPSTATGAGAAIASGTGRVASGSTAIAVGMAIIAGVGAAASTSVARAAATAITAGAGTSTATSVAVASGGTIATGTGTSSTPSVAQGAGASVAAGTGQSASPSRPVGAGGAIARGDGSSVSLSLVAGSASSQTPPSVGVSASGSSAFGIGLAIAAGDGRALSSGTARGSGSAIAAGSGQSASLALAGGAGASVVVGVGRSFSHAFAAGTTDQLHVSVLLDEPLLLDFDALDTAIDFGAIDTALAFDALDTQLLFLTFGGDDVFRLKLIRGESVPVTITLMGRDLVTGLMVPYDLTGATSKQLTVGKAGKTAIIAARDLDLAAPAEPTSGRVTFTPTVLETAAGGIYQALAVIVFPGTPNPIVRKFKGEIEIDDAVA